MNVYDMWYNAAPGVGVYYMTGNVLEGIDSFNVVQLSIEYNVKRYSIDCIGSEMIIVLDLEKKDE